MTENLIKLLQIAGAALGIPAAAAGTFAAYQRAPRKIPLAKSPRI
jgi:hypothetical protein